MPTPFERKSTAGRKLQISVLDKLVITLQYWREYRTYRPITFDYGVGKRVMSQNN
ncbi:MAG: transposase family protein [Oscillospiraceae bacterium]|nr:transposase family protein [Oscillospiraceae bacterium]